MCVIPSLIVVVNKGGWRSKMTKMLLGFLWVFWWQHGIKSLRLCWKSRRKERRKRFDVMRESRKQCVSLDVQGRYVHHSHVCKEICSQKGDMFAKVVFAVWGEKRWSHREFVVLVVLGRSVNLSRKCCPEVKSLGVGAEFRIAVDIANFGGDVKLFPCVAYWIHIQLGTLGLREIDARDP